MELQLCVRAVIPQRYSIVAPVSPHALTAQHSFQWGREALDLCVLAPSNYGINP